MHALAFSAVVAACAPHVDVTTAQALVAVESGFNPHAIGVVGGQLEHQPHTRAEGLATARRLRLQGWNYSVGLAQINVRNFARLAITDEDAFDPCVNLAAMQTLLCECYGRAQRGADSAQGSLRRALSCYYSGNFVTGFEHGYVRRVTRAGLSLAASTTPSTLQTKERP